MRDTSTMLTPKQRQYLHDPETADVELDGAAERMLRSRIRDRALHGILDFQLLRKQNPKDREQVFEKTERQKFLDAIDTDGRLRGRSQVPDKEDADELIGGITDAIAYFYLGLLDRGMSKNGIENLFTKGVSQAVAQVGNGQLPQVSVEIGVEYPTDRPATELYQAFMDGEELSKDERRLILEHAPGLPLEKAFSDMVDDSDSE